MAETKDQYSKAFVVSFKSDKASYDETKKLIDSLSKSLSQEGGFSEETLKILQEYSETLGNSKIEFVKKDGEVQAQEMTEDANTKVVDTINKIDGFITDKISELGNFIKRKVETFFTDLLRDTLDEIKEINKYQYLSNRDVREQAFTYGFNAAQNYAFSKASDLLGVSSEEDLMFLEPNQRAKFQEKFIEYSERYTKLYDSGFFNTLQDFTWEWQEFKEDLQYELIDFFMTNKDLLKTLMVTGMNVLQEILNVVGAINDSIGVAFGSRGSTVSDIINNTVSNANTTVKIDNTFNNVSRNDQQWLANAGTMTYQQIITALGGDV